MDQNAGHAVPHDNSALGDVNVTSSLETVAITRSGDAFAFAEARARRDAGMASALDHAEQIEPEWGERCFLLLCDFAARQHSEFTIEAFRAWAHANGLPVPPESRAFGPVTQRAIRHSVIVRTGYAPAASSNGSPKPVYSRTARAA